MKEGENEGEERKKIRKWVEGDLGPHFLCCLRAAWAGSRTVAGQHRGELWYHEPIVRVQLGPDHSESAGVFPWQKALWLLWQTAAGVAPDIPRDG